jgi:hypothetical protein
LDNEKAKNSTHLSENEIMALLQLMFELGIQFNKVSVYQLDSYIKKFNNKFSSKRGIQLHLFLETIMTLDTTKLYKPKELNKIISANFRNYVPNLLNNLGLINDEQLISIKKDVDLISPRDLTELLSLISEACNNFFISVDSGILSIADFRPFGTPFLIYFQFISILFISQNAFNGLM